MFIKLGIIVLRPLLIPILLVALLLIVFLPLPCPITFSPTLRYYQTTATSSTPNISHTPVISPPSTIRLNPNNIPILTISPTPTTSLNPTYSHIPTTWILLLKFLYQAPLLSSIFLHLLTPPPPPSWLLFFPPSSILAPLHFYFPNSSQS